jgi:hypothetical protein
MKLSTKKICFIHNFIFILDDMAELEKNVLLFCTIVLMEFERNVRKGLISPVQ